MKASIVSAAGIGIALLCASSSGRSPAGDASGYRFHEAPVNSMGVKGMADLRGKPVLIDFWGTR